MTAIQILDKGYVELLDHMGNDLAVASAARVSHLGESKGAEKDAILIQYLMDNRHTSPFEHVVFSFRIKCPLFVRSQWMRHRTWSYNEISRRYTSDDIDFYIPTEFRGQNLVNKQSSSPTKIAEILVDNGDDYEYYAVKDFMEELAKFYKSNYNLLIRNGVARELARMVLPQNLYTVFYGTVDLHNLFHFLELRNSPHAQEEIRVYAEAIESIIKEIVPISYNAWKKFQERQLNES